MIIDCHYHLDTRLASLDDLIKGMDAHGIDKVALMASMNDPVDPPGPFLVSLVQFTLTRRLFRPFARSVMTRFTPQGDAKLPGSTVRIYPDPDNGPVFNLNPAVALCIHAQLPVLGLTPLKPVRTGSCIGCSSIRGAGTMPSTNSINGRMRPGL